jgi:lipoprotein-releasing system permease protein
MNWSDRLTLALRYTFGFRDGHLSTFLSNLSMLGLILAIGLLIIVLSVMNGFDKEMRERILSLVPHVTIHSHTPIVDWRDTLSLVSTHPEVVEASAFTQFDALFMHGSAIETARGIGLDTSDGAAVQRLLGSLQQRQREDFLARPDGLVLGRGVADSLSVEPGQRITLVVPGSGNLGERGARFESLYVSGVLDTGTELDQGVALVHLTLASQLAGLGDAVNGIRVTTRDLFAASRTGWELMNKLPTGFYTTNWMMTHGNLYSAIQLSRDLVSILLLSIIAVAAFNVVSSLVLVVFDKQGNIAILRTLGASPSDIAWVFVLQGGMIGLVGVAIGSALGAAGSQLVPQLVVFLEGLLDMRFLNTDVYPVSFLPVDLLWSDVLLVGGVAFVMCLLAALYPALRAAGVAPAVVLNQDRS